MIVPAPSAGVRSHYLEAREKQSFDWPLVSVAIVLDSAPGAKTVRDARVVMGAVAPVPVAIATQRKPRSRPGRSTSRARAPPPRPR